jgi:serine/threonine protein kinase
MRVELPSVETVFSEAMEIAAPAERAAYLDRACGGDASLRRQVESLLDAHTRAGGFLESPAAAPTCTLGPTPPAEGPGEAVGPYRLLEEIGEGGMGTVYMAEQTQPVRRRVALKVIKPGMDSRQVVARFEAERQALALMDHPHIARVLDAGATASGRPFFVMELVRGLPITDYCDREQLGVPERLELFVLVCRAVQHAHQKGVIHRDIKPSNVLVTVVDGVPTPKVIDFGVAKATGGSLTERTLFTGFHQMVGTPLYMSPEQADLTSADVDTRSDIYALGVLLYELLTGSTPFDRERFAKAAFDEMRRIIREDEPPTPSTRLGSLGESLSTVSARRGSDPRRLNRVVRGELDWIAMKALEKDRRRRYETANDFAADVMRYLTDRPVEACPPTARYRLGKYARRHRAALTTGSLLALALIAGTAASTWQAFRATAAEGHTATALAEARGNLAEANRQRALARKAVDEMYTEAAQKWLAGEGRLTPLQREFLEKALAFYQEFAAQKGDDPAVQAELAEAALRVGDIRSTLGRYEQAVASYEQARGVLRRLAPPGPGPGRARDRAPVPVPRSHPRGGRGHPTRARRLRRSRGPGPRSTRSSRRPDARTP